MSLMSPALRIVFALVAISLFSPVVVGKAEEQQQPRVYYCGGLGERACNTGDDGWGANGGHSCDAHLAESLSDGTCVEPDYVPFKRRQGVGKNFRQSWAGNALRTQSRNINLFTPIDQLPQLSVHNAYENVADGYLEAATQRYSITEMLDAGFRHIELDVHETLAHDLRLSHGAPAAGDRSPHNVFKEIRQWMLEPGHLKEVLIIQVENYITDYSADKIAHWNDPIKTFLDTPDIGVWDFTQSSPFLDPPYKWPTQEEMVREKKRVIFIMFGHDVQSIDPYVYAIGNQSRDMNVLYRPSTNECPIWSRSWQDHSLVTEPFTALGAKFSDIYYADTFPGSRPNAEEIAHYTRCAVDSLKINRLLDPDYNVPRLGAAIWTWAELEPLPSPSPTAAFLDWESRRWKTSDRDVQRPFLCGKTGTTNSENETSIVLRLATTSTGGTAMGKWSDGFAACNRDGYRFWVPRNGPEAELAVILNHDAWLNFAPDSTGEWIAGNAPSLAGVFVETFASRFERGETVTFSVRATDTDFNATLLNEHLTISWDFGDGTTVTDDNPTRPGSVLSTRKSVVDHAFAAAGTYTIKATVRDSVGIVDESSLEFEVSGASKPNIQLLGPTSSAWGSTGSYVLFGFATENDPVSVVSITCGDEAPLTQEANQLAPNNPNLFLRFTCQFPPSFVEVAVTATIRDVDGNTTTTTIVKAPPVTGVISGPALSSVGKSETYYVDVTGSGGITSVTGTCGPHGTRTAGPSQTSPTQFGIKCKFTGPDPANPVTFTFMDGTGLTGSAETLVEIEATDTTPPDLTLPGDATIEAASAGGATYSFVASANDATDGPVPVTCTPSSGAVFGINPTTSKTTTVECSATDANHNTATGSFTVTVRDSIPPAVTVPTAIDATATGAATKVNFTVTVSDDVDGTDVPVACSPASGADFPVGKTQVICSATDKHGNRSADRSFDVTVQDSTPPSISVANVIAEATGPNGAAVAFTASAVDTIDPRPAVVCVNGSILPDGQVIGSPVAPGDTFALGVSRISCAATDASNNKSVATFTITVRDTIAPAVSYIGNAGSYDADQTLNIRCAATDGGSGVAATTCADIVGPAAMFAAGANIYSATATDAAGNIGHGSTSFTVVVSATALQNMVSRFSTNADVAAGLNAKLAAAAQAKNANARAGQLGAFVNQVRAQTGKALTADAANTLLRLVAALN